MYMYAQNDPSANAGSQSHNHSRMFAAAGMPHPCLLQSGVLSAASNSCIAISQHPCPDAPSLFLKDSVKNLIFLHLSLV